MEQVQEGAVEEEEEQVLLCLVQMEQEEVGNPWSAVGWMVVGEEACCVRRTFEDVGSEMQSVLVEVEEEDHLCLLEEAGVGPLLVLEVDGRKGSPAAVGLG